MEMDPQLLAPMSAASGRLGYEDPFHGEGAAEADITITRNEIDRLAESYLDDLAGLYASHKRSGHAGFTENIFVTYAWGRLSDFDLAGAITDERVSEIMDYLEKKHKLFNTNEMPASDSVDDDKP